MSFFKRRAGETDDSGEDELMAKALYVDPDYLEGEEDSEGPPVSAADYLRRVAKEAKALPDIVSAKPPPLVTPAATPSNEKTPKAENFKHHKTPSDSSTGAGALPSKDWIESQVSEFSAVRLKLERHRACLALGKSGETQEIATSSSSTPKLQNEKGWASFCFGAPFWKRVCAAREDSDSESKPSKRSKTWDDNETGQLPLLSYLIKYKPNQIITLLETHVEWAQDLVEVSPEQSLWVYALLALVEKPLHGDDVSTIRSLAKVARKHRASLLDTSSTSTNAANVSHLNLVICIVANYFQQKDLSD